MKDLLCPTVVSTTTNFELDDFHFSHTCMIFFIELENMRIVTLMHVLITI